MSYKEMYDKWMEEGPHYCECGCGGKLSPSYSSFLNTVKYRGSFPRYRWGHHTRVKQRDYRERTVIVTQFRNCKIQIVGLPVRCFRYKKCSNYLECLDFVVARNRGLGWIRIGEIGGEK